MMNDQAPDNALRVTPKNGQHFLLHEIFECAARRWPKLVAVDVPPATDRSERVLVTYAELSLQAVTIARILQLCVTGECIVGILLPRNSALLYAAQLAVLQAGAAYMCLDPMFPDERIRDILEDSKATAVLTDAVGFTRIKSAAPDVAQVIDASAYLADLVPQDKPVASPSWLTSDSLAYVIYTSGTTGRPKGVLIEHRSIANLVHGDLAEFGLAPGDRVGQSSSAAYDSSVEETWLALASGATLVVMDDDTVRLGPNLISWLRRERISVFCPPPTLLRSTDCRDPETQLPDLKLLYVGGEALPRDVADCWARGRRLVNGYGPTECTVTSVRGDVVEGGPLTIGRAVPGLLAWVLDETLQAVAIGEQGELCLGGVGLARAYWQRPELTIEKFVQHAALGRLYRTGDLVHCDDQGRHHYHGRLDHQVKIRGYRIELGEIEAVLGGHPGVCTCAVVAQSHVSGDKILAAFVIPRDPVNLTVEPLRLWLGEKLPQFMIPSRFFVLSALPLTSSGKIDRKALEMLEGVELAVGSDYVAPRNELERTLAEIWQAVLRREKVGMHDNFFDLGGHSLQAVRVAAEIGQLLGCKLPIATLFQSPTVESLARRFTNEQWVPAWSSLVPLQPLGTKTPLFLVHGWGGDVYVFLGLAQLMAPDQPVYGIQARGLDGKAERHISVESMAAHYIQEIRSLQPEGPYFLGGYSLGGMIAYEVAQQLERLGQRVGLLALFDNSPNGVLPWTIFGQILATYLSQRGVFHLQRWWKLPDRERLEYLRGRWLALQFWMARNRPKPPVLTAPPPPDIQAPQVAGFGDYYQAVGSAYQYRQYPGAADVFVSDETQLCWMSGWRYFARGGVTFHRVPGKHSEIFSPDNVPVLAKALTNVLHRAYPKESTLLNVLAPAPPLLLCAATRTTAPLWTRPMSFGQQRMWLLQQTLPESATYNLLRAYRLRGRVDAGRFRQALEIIVERHEVLRTALVDEGGELLQRIYPAAEIPLPWDEVDWRTVPADQKEAMVEHRLAEEVRRPFDLSQAPLWRVMWLRLAEDNHLLLLNFHHSLMDVWSLRLLFKEWSQLYAAGARVESACLPELPVQYAEHAVWQRAQLTGEWLAREQSYWREQLKDLPPPLELPTFGARPLQRSGKGAVHRFEVPDTLATALLALAQAQGVTIFRLMLAAFQVWLHRYTGQTDIIVGTPVANRKRAETQSLIGFFLNTLPIRTQVVDGLSFLELIDQVQENVRTALDHSELPFEQIVAQTAQGRDRNRTPLYQVMFVMTSNLASQWSLDGVEVGEQSVHAGTSMSDMAFTIRTQNAAWVGEIEYASDLFTAQSVERMALHFEELLRSIVADPDETVGRLSILPAEERRRLLVEWNATRTDYPKHKCVHQLFEEQVERSPDAVAVVCGEQSLTYQELNARANQLAYHLLALGVGPEVLVGICVERSLEMVVGLLAILKAGGAYVPLDPSLPKDRLAHMIEDSAMPVLLAENRVAGCIGSHTAQVVGLDEFAWKPDLELGNLFQRGAPSSLAYVIFTSGSTGTPKGVEISHQALVNCLCHFKSSLDVRPHDAWLAVTTLSFDIAGLEIWLPLIAGARVIVATREMAMDGGLLSQGLINHGATILQATPATWQMLLQSKWPGNPEFRMLCGGEAMPLELAERLASLGSRAWNVYGPTETTIWSTTRQLVHNQTVTIGGPLANTQIYVLDAHNQPMPVGVPGGLFIGGDGLARGYLNAPELTTARFIADPFAPEPGARLYKTGDLARWLPDGSIEFLGRMDHQVKIRGFRIELGEIEAALGGHPGLSACAVVTHNHGGGDKILTAFVVGLEQADLSVEALRQWLGEKLPEYMIPSRFFVLPALPLTSNGKVDRKALEMLDGVELAVGVDYVAPRNERERGLVEIWQAVLRREKIGMHDNFFALGGHSLLAVQAVSRITQLLKLEVPLRWLFDYPTVAGLAKQMEPLSSNSQDAQPIEKADREQPLPMSFAQQAMWLLQQTLPDPATYNVPVVLRLSGAVEREKVRRALQVILNRHEVLRTALVLQGDDLIQQVKAAQDVPLPWLEVDLQAVPSSEQQSALEQHLQEEARRPFDLAVAPLWRAVWITLASAEQVLAFNFHHSIADEWSLRLFFRELEQLYAADGRVELAGLPGLTLQYADYAVWQRQRLTGNLLEQQRAYWKDQLRDMPPALELPGDFPRPAHPSGRGASHAFQLAAPVVARLRELAREEGTTLFMLMLAAFHIWLHRYTGEPGVVVGTPVANRLRPEIESLVGFFLNTLPIRLRLHGNPAFREVLRQLRESLLGAFSHADLPFEQMVEMAATNRDTGRQPIYQVMFVLLEEGISEFQLDQAKARLLPVATGTSKNDLTLSIQAVGDTWDCRLEYATDLFTAQTAARMGRHLAELLRSITTDPDLSIGYLNLMPEAERHQVLVEWNQTTRDYPRDKCVHQLFEEQVERTPHAVAVVFEEQSLTYMELNMRANQLARHLLSLGVGPEVLVGLCLERSLEMMVAVLGILKAGGAYWAIEDNLPIERLELMLKEARPLVILANQAALQRVTDTVTKIPIDSKIIIFTEELICPDASQTWIAETATRPDHPAYVSYTSGSTGQPKGVVVPHRGVVRLVKGANYVSLTAEDTMLHLSPLSFDASTFEIWGALLNGGKVVILPPGPPTLAEIGASIRRYEVTTLWLTAGLFHLMVEQRLEDLRPLRQLLAGGDVLQPETVHKATRSLPECRIINGYGPTENTTFTCCYQAEANSTLPQNVPIGRPIANTQVYILDKQLQPVPVGVAGELHAGGAGLALGYLNNPDLTKKHFIADPFNPEPGSRLYKTGDLARYLPDGNIEFLGRLDHQVKIRGFRIELGEIEAVLGGHPDLSACVVVTQYQNDGDKSLAAFVVGSGLAEPTVEALRQWLLTKLPEYMIPSRFFALAALPLTPNGKLDRQALEMSDGVELAVDSDYVAPRNERERELAGIWQAVLRREQVGIHDNFFALGGHSLLAVQAVSRMGQALGVELTLRTLFEFPTIAALAGELPMHQDTTAMPSASLVPMKRNGHLPLSFAQQRLWFLDRFEGTSTAYHMSNAMRLRGVLKRDALEWAVKEIVARHESLRMNFVEVDGEPVQVVAEVLKIALPVEDLSMLGDGARDAAIAAALRQKCEEPFDLSQDPLLRVSLFKLGDSEHMFLLVFHHIVSDGWSMAVFNRELAVLYRAFCEGRDNPLESLAVQYLDFTLWQRQRLQGKELERQVGYWTHKLKGAPPMLAIPTDKPRAARRSRGGGSCTLALPGDLARSLSGLCQREGVTLFMGLLAAFKVLLARYSGQEDVVIGTPIASRNHVDLEGLIGFFVSTVVIRTDLSDNPTFLELLKRVRTTALEAFEHQDLPFEKLIEELHLQRDTSHAPVFQVFFNMLNLEEVPVSLLDLEVERIPLPEPDAKFDITLYAIQEREEIKLHAVYNTELFHGETIERMLAQLHLLLEQMALDPAASIYSYALVRPQDRAVLPDPSSPLSHSEEKTIQDGFAVQAQRVPQRIAVVDAKDEWTYAELKLMSNRLANHLRREGVRNGDVVAVYASRSAALVWCLIGIMKAGGAFLILDSAYPARRLCGCIAQAKPVALLTLASAGVPPGVIKECVGRDALSFQLDIPANRTQVLAGFLSHCDATDPMISVTGDDPAYVAFTSGSTGEPLGIQGTHSPTSHFLRWHIDRFGLGEDDRFSLLSGLAHDPLLRDVFTPLWLGASLHIPPAEVREESGAMARWVREQRITVCHLTPALTELLGEPAAGNPDALDSLRWVFLGGDKLTHATVQRLRRWTASCGLVNFYGTTETPQAMGYHVIEASEVNGRHPGQEVPLGRGIDGVQLLLLNPAGQVSGIGELAEICVRTRYLSKGYLGDDPRVRDRFRSNPFTAVPDDRIYRTGDMGRYLAGGGVALAGRKDAQVKIRGFRVELCEIEAALRGLPDVREAVVMAHEDTPGDNRLVAYLVSRADKKVDAANLRAMLLDKLPDYMLPSAIMWLDQVPLTPNGKVDRRALPAPEKSSSGMESGANQPANLLELELTGIWQRLFNRQDIGIHDNFFELGGHSLQAVRVAAEIGKLLGCKLPIATLFQSPTVESLARRLTDEQWVPAWSSLVPLQPQGTKPPLFLVHGWAGDVYVFLGLAQLLAPDQPVYGIQALGLDGKAARHITIESMAAHYVEEIRSFQPEGPYFLGGYSMGGSIAYEVAQQLGRLGQRVALLALFDSRPKGVLPWTIYARIMATHLSQRGVFHLQHWWKKPSRERLDYLRGRWLALQFWVGWNRPKPPVITAPPAQDIQAPQVAGFDDYYQAVGAAYQYRQYPGAADVFVSDETQLYWMSGWRYFARGGVSFHRVPGKHAEILAPENMPVLAKALASVLQRAYLAENLAPSPSQPADATRIS